MKHSMAVVVITVVFSTCGWGQTDITSTWKTDGKWNGRFWRTLSEDQKVAFLNGYIQALQFVSDEGEARKEVYRWVIIYWPMKLTVGEVVKSLDRIYDVPENGPIPIAQVVSTVIVMRAAGAEEDPVQKKIAELRAKAAIK